MNAYELAMQQKQKEIDQKKIKEDQLKEENDRRDEELNKLFKDLYEELKPFEAGGWLLKNDEKEYSLTKDDHIIHVRPVWRDIAPPRYSGSTDICQLPTDPEWALKIYIYENDHKNTMEIYFKYFVERFAKYMQELI